MRIYLLRKRGDHIAYNYSLIGVHVALHRGTFTEHDEVHVKGDQWEPIHQVPELIPAQMLPLSYGMGLWEPW